MIMTFSIYIFVILYEYRNKLITTTIQPLKGINHFRLVDYVLMYQSFLLYLTEILDYDPSYFVCKLTTIK